MRKIVSLLAVAVFLTACNAASPQMDAAMPETGDIAGQPKTDPFKAIIGQKHPQVEGPLITMARAAEICRGIRPGTTNMRDVMNDFGMLGVWLHNHGGIESGGWKVSDAGVPATFLIFYDRRGKIRNAGVYGPSMKALMGVNQAGGRTENCS